MAVGVRGKEAAEKGWVAVATVLGVVGRGDGLGVVVV